MTDEIKAKKKPTSKKAVALKGLYTSNGAVKKCEEFTCTVKEYEYFKNLKAV